MENTQNIQWFPGHMAKARRMISDSVRLVDAVCEIVDARIPMSSRNPELDELTAGKPRMIILNRTDLADPEVTALWSAKFKADGLTVLETDSKSGKGTAAFSAAVRRLMAVKLKSLADKGQAGKPLRVMVVGIPNVGKSSFINRISKRKSAKTSDRPGVTRGKQWITVDAGLELLDTPGLLWPRFDSREVGLRLAFTGAVKDQVFDVETLSFQLMRLLAEDYPERLTARYKIEPLPGMEGHELLKAAAKKRGFLLTGGELDTERMAAILLDEFRGGLLGRISLERPKA